MKNKLSTLLNLISLAKSSEHPLRNSNALIILCICCPIVHICLCIFLYINYGLIPFILYVFISTAIYLIIEHKNKDLKDTVKEMIKQRNKRQNPVFFMDMDQGFSEKTVIIYLFLFFLMNSAILIVLMNIDGLNEILFMLAFALPNIFLRLLFNKFKKKKS